MLKEEQEDISFQKDGWAQKIVDSNPGREEQHRRLIKKEKTKCKINIKKKN